MCVAMVRLTQCETRPHVPQSKGYLHCLNHSLSPTLCTTCQSLYRKYKKGLISAAASASIYSVILSLFWSTHLIDNVKANICTLKSKKLYFDFMGTLTANSVFVRVSASKCKVAKQIAVFEIVFEHVTW